MRPIFTIHAGEYLVSSYIEKEFKDLNVWVPSKDSGIDLLVTDKTNKKAISLQVKFSKDFLPNNTTEFLRQNLKAFGWWSINADKLRESEADLWVFVLVSIYNKEEQYVVMPRQKLLEIFTQLHGDKKLWQVYLTVTNTKKCWETRGLSPAELNLIAKDEFSDPKRNLSQWMNWGSESDPLFSLMIEK